MANGISAVTQGMKAAEKVTANIGIDLSNANTPGYKSFDNFLISETSKYNGGVSATYRARTDFQGEIMKTDNEFDYAIAGRGLLVVECDGKKRYTTAGRFDVNKNGYLYNPNGCYLMGEKYEDNEEQKQAILPSSESFGKIKVPLNDYVRGEPTTKATVNAKLSATQDVYNGDPAYNANTSNMASGTLKTDFKQEFTVFDSVGKRHSVFVAFKRTVVDKYTVEVYAKKEELNTTDHKNDGLVAVGEIKFDANGKFDKIENIDPLPSNVKNLDDEITFNWKKGTDANALTSTTKMTIDWSNIEMFGEKFSGDIEANGSTEGALVKTDIDDNGNLVGNYTNGASKLIAAIPVVSFKNPSELQHEFGTAFSDNSKSGEPEYFIAGEQGAGKILGGSLENSNVDSTQCMTALMKQQRFYTYNAKAYGMMNGMENELLNVIRV